MRVWILLAFLLSSLSHAATQTPEQQSRALLETYLKEKPLWTWNWNWGTGILLFGLQNLARVADDADFFAEPLRSFHKSRPDGPLRVMWSDQCIPALTALSPDTPIQDTPTSVTKVIRYLKETQRNKLGSLDHFSPGSPASWIFPSSMWLDSLVMWGVFALHYGKEHDRELFDFALEQGPLFQSVLWNASDKLFYHAWNLEKNQLYPPDNVYWLRGNAWVTVYLVEALSLLDAGDPRFLELLSLFRQLTQSLVSHQRSDGMWGTLVAEESYAESSGTALVAYSIAKGIRLGFLSSELLPVVNHAWQGLQQHLRAEKSRLYLGQISKGTNPGDRRSYLKVPVAENLNYGLGAYFLLASELKN